VVDMTFHGGLDDAVESNALTRHDLKGITP
jgi:hypothetical protein